MRTIVPALTALMVGGCGPVEVNSVGTSSLVQYEGVAYRRVGQGELRSTLIGSTVRSPDVITSGDNHWRYDPSGNYWSKGHYGASQVGRYWFDGDVICHRLSAAEWCTVIYKGPNDQFIIKVVRSSGSSTGGYERITISRGVTPFPWQ